MSIKNYELKDGTVMCYEDVGEGRPVIFIPGWGENKFTMSMYKDAVVNAGYRYIALDQRASKDTTPSKTRPVRVEQLVDDIYDLIHGLGLTDVTMVGHSMGVTEILNYVKRYGNEPLRSACLWDAPPRQTCAPDWEYAVWNNTYTVEKAYEACDWMDRDLFDYLSHWVLDSSPEMRNAPDPEKAAQDWARDYMAMGYPEETAELFRSTVEFDNRDALDKFTVPVSYFYPDPGSICKSDLWTVYRDGIKSDFTAVPFPSTSHFFCGEEELIPDITKALLDFLKK